MKAMHVISFRFSKPFLVTGLLLGSVCVPGTAGAAEYRAGSLRIDQPWSVATPKGAKVGVGYMKITNEGTQADRLISITSTASRKATLHDMVQEGDVMKMRLMEQGLEIKPGETVELAPQGKHVMFEELGAPLVAGDHVNTTLMFEKAGSVRVEYDIAPLGTKMPSGSHKM
jgi:copper(I)-binding protein